MTATIIPFPIARTAVGRTTATAIRMASTTEAGARVSRSVLIPWERRMRLLGVDRAEASAAVGRALEVFWPASTHHRATSGGAA